MSLMVFFQKVNPFLHIWQLTRNYKILKGPVQTTECIFLGFTHVINSHFFLTKTKEDVSIIIAFNSRRIGSGHQHGRHFIVWGHQHGGRDVTDVKSKNCKTDLETFHTCMLHCTWWVWTKSSKHRQLRNCPERDIPQINIFSCIARSSLYHFLLTGLGGIILKRWLYKWMESSHQHNTRARAIPCGSQWIKKIIIVIECFWKCFGM